MGKSITPKILKELTLTETVPLPLSVLSNVSQDIESVEFILKTVGVDNPE